MTETENGFIFGVFSICSKINSMYDYIHDISHLLGVSAKNTKRRKIIQSQHGDRDG